MARDLRAIVTLRNVIMSDYTHDRVLSHLTHKHLVGLDVLYCVRGALSIALWVIGSLWLGRTYDLEDLLLNAAALGFVLELPNLLYAVMPRYFQTELSSHRPLKLSISARPTYAIATIVGVLCVVLTTLWSCVVPLENEFKLAKYELCGGNTNVVIDTNARVGVNYAMRTTPYDENAANDLTFLMRAAKEIVQLDLDAGELPQLSYVAPSQNDFDYMINLEMSAFAAFTVCADNLEATSWLLDESQNFRFIANAFKEQTGVDYCSELTMDECTVPSQGLARALCPVTCGCVDPRGGFIYADLYHGCPQPCLDEATSTAESLDCEDMDASAILPGWKAYWEQQAGFDEFYGAEVNLNYTQLSAGGCDLVPSLAGNTYELDFCADNPVPAQAAYVSLAAFCPIACGCANPNSTARSTWCPSSCLATR